MEILNLDALLPAQKFITFQGKQHALQAQTTKTYLQIVQAQKKLADLGDHADEEQQTRFAVDLIHLAIPTISREDLLALPVFVNMKLVEIIQQELTQDMGQMSDQSRRAVTEDGPGAGEWILVDSSRA